MKLITKEIQNKIANMYDTADLQDNQKRVYVRFFSTLNNSSFYAVEYDKETKDFFGFFKSSNPMDSELTYMNLNHMNELNSKTMGLAYERDLHWDDTTTLDKVK